jgi:hypothetical protein
LPVRAPAEALAFDFKRTVARGFDKKNPFGTLLIFGVAEYLRNFAATAGTVAICRVDNSGSE